MTSNVLPAAPRPRFPDRSPPIRSSSTSTTRQANHVRDRPWPDAICGATSTRCDNCPTPKRVVDPTPSHRFSDWSHATWLQTKAEAVCGYRGTSCPQSPRAGNHIGGTRTLHAPSSMPWWFERADKQMREAPAAWPHSLGTFVPSQTIRGTR